MYLIFCALNLMKMFWVMRPFGDLPFFIFMHSPVNVIVVFFLFLFFLDSFMPVKTLRLEWVCLFCFNLHKSDQ